MNKKLSRKEQSKNNPLSPHWTLYRPREVTEKLLRYLNVRLSNYDPYDIVHRALIETGFNKAVRVRKGLTQWKARILKEQKELTHEIQTLDQQRVEKVRRFNALTEQLDEIRNILRIPREPNEDDPESKVNTNEQ